MPRLAPSPDELLACWRRRGARHPETVECARAWLVDELQERWVGREQLGERGDTLRRLGGRFCVGIRVFINGPGFEARLDDLLHDLLALTGLARPLGRRHFRQRLTDWFLRRRTQLGDEIARCLADRLAACASDSGAQELTANLLGCGQALFWSGLVDDRDSRAAAWCCCRNHHLVVRDHDGRIQAEDAPHDEFLDGLLRQWLLDAGCCPVGSAAALVTA